MGTKGPFGSTGRPHHSNFPGSQYGGDSIVFPLVDMDFIGKVLDRGMFHEGIIEKLGNTRVRGVVDTLSEHMIIILSWRVELECRGVPFKFNRTWLDDPEYNQLVMEFWKRDISLDGGDKW